MDAHARLMRYNAVFLKHRPTMMEIYTFIHRGLYDAAYEAYNEIRNEDLIDLNIAHSKGGLFWPHEQQIVVRGVDKTSGWSVWNNSVSQTAEDGL